MVGTKVKAFVVGGTGEVGKALVTELAKDGRYETVVLIGRREVKFPEASTASKEVDKATPTDEAKTVVALPDYTKFQQKVVNFDELEQNHKDVFSDCEVGFCTLGTTRGKAGKEGFYKVDHDYTMAAARLAKESGCKHFHLVSSSGANKNAYFYYPQVKGEVEDELKALSFDRLSIYRPALLLVDREESRYFEKALRCVVGPLDYFRTMSIDVPVLAKRMADNTFTPLKDKVEIFDNKGCQAAVTPQVVT